MAEALFRWAISVIRWTLRAAAYIALGGLALIAFAFAGFAALAPDVVGFGVYVVQVGVDEWLTELRRRTVFYFDQTMQAQFTGTGYSMLVTAVLAGLVMVGLIVLMVLNARRRRGTVSGPL